MRILASDVSADLLLTLYKFVGRAFGNQLQVVMNK
jgi:hypothetical protein